MSAGSGSITAAALISRWKGDEVAGIGIMTGIMIATMAPMASQEAKSFRARLMTCIVTIARPTLAAACNWSSNEATPHAGKAAAGAMIVAGSGWITAAGPISRWDAKEKNGRLSGGCRI